jgi:hypothetical protein
MLRSWCPDPGGKFLFYFVMAVFNLFKAAPHLYLEQAEKNGFEKSGVTFTREMVLPHRSY